MPTHYVDPDVEAQRRTRERILQAQQQQEQLAGQAPQMQRGFLEQGQGGLMDAIRNPSQGQVDALIGGLAGALNPNSAAPLISGAVGGLSALQQRRSQELQARREQFESQNEMLQNRIDNLQGLSQVDKRAADIGIAKGNLGVSRANLGQRIAEHEDTSGRAERRLKHEMKDVDAAGAVEIGGQRYRGFQRQGRIYAFDENNEPVEVSGNPNARFLRDVDQQTTVNVGGQKEMLSSGIKRANELQEEATSKTMAAQQASRILDAFKRDPNTLTGTGAGLINDARGLVKTAGEFAGINTDSMDLSSVEEIRSASAKLVLPYLEKESRASDRDLQMFQRAVGGETTSRKGNQILMSAVIGDAKAQSEFADLYSEYVVQMDEGQRRHVFDADKVFRQYTQDLPRYDDTSGIPEPVQDNGELWRYWAKAGGTPQFVLKNGATRDMQWVKAKAKEQGLHPRAFLDSLSSQNLIIGVE